MESSGTILALVVLLVIVWFAFVATVAYAKNLHRKLRALEKGKGKNTNPDNSPNNL